MLTFTYNHTCHQHIPTYTPSVIHIKSRLHRYLHTQYHTHAHLHTRTHPPSHPTHGHTCSHSRKQHSPVPFFSMATSAGRPTQWAPQPRREMRDLHVPRYRARTSSPAVSSSTFLGVHGSGYQSLAASPQCLGGPGVGPCSLGEAYTNSLIAFHTDWAGLSDLLSVYVYECVSV